MKTSLSSQAYMTVWVLLNCGEMKTFWFWWRQCFCMSLFWYTGYLLPGQTLELTRNVDSITFAYPFTSSLYFFLSLFKRFLNVALSLWLNMHSNHSAMQNNDGLSIWKTNSCTWWLFCFGVALLSSQRLRNKINNW